MLLVSKDLKRDYCASDVGAGVADGIHRACAAAAESITPRRADECNPGGQYRNLSHCG